MTGTDIGQRPIGPIGIVTLTMGAVMMLAPFYFMFVFATHPRSEIFSMPPPLWFGDSFLQNLDILRAKIPLWRNLGWSVYVGLMSTALTLLFCAMGGYAFAVYEFRFKKQLFGIVMATMLILSLIHI